MAVPPRRGHLGRELEPVWSSFEREIFEGFERRGFGDLRPGHQHVLIHIDDEGTTLRDLARRAGISKQAMFGFVQDLENRGYLERIPDPADGRAKLIRTTDRGERSFEAAWHTLKEIEERWKRIVGARRLQEFRVVLRELAADYAARP